MGGLRRWSGLERMRSGWFAQVVWFGEDAQWVVCAGGLVWRGCAVGGLRRWSGLERMRSGWFALLEGALAMVMHAVSTQCKFWK